MPRKSTTTRRHKSPADLPAKQSLEQAEHLPDMESGLQALNDADIESFAALDIWDVIQGLCLIGGRRPTTRLRKAVMESLKPNSAPFNSGDVRVDEWVISQRETFNQARNSLQSQRLKQNNAPVEFIKWAHSKRISVDRSIEDAVMLANDLPTVETLRSGHAQVLAERAQLEAQLVAANDEIERLKRQLNERGKHIIQTHVDILGAGLHCVFTDYDSICDERGKPTATKLAEKINDLRHQYGFRDGYPTHGTILKRVREAVKNTE